MISQPKFRMLKIYKSQLDVLHVLLVNGKFLYLNINFYKRMFAKLCL